MHTFSYYSSIVWTLGPIAFLGIPNNNETNNTHKNAHILIIFQHLSDSCAFSFLGIPNNDETNNTHTHTKSHKLNILRHC